MAYSPQVRRVLVVLVGVLLVNLPFLHERLTDRAVTRSGEEVVATVLDARRLGGIDYVDYRLPEDADPSGTRFSARVDDATFRRARESRRLLVRVVPGKPAENRPAGMVANHMFTLIAVFADVILLVVALLFWRSRRRDRFEVVGLGDDEALLGTGLATGLATGADRLTVATPPGWAAGQQVGRLAPGRLHLVAASDVMPGLPLAGFEHLGGSSYVVRGRVADARTGRVVLEVGDRLRLQVETGPHRIRADVRESAQVQGVLCFTPRGITSRGRR